jgi:calcineurin-like phosphoesterase family protein
MAIYITADLHFGHTNIIKHCGRPFNNFAEMDETLIINWNSVVRPDDNVYILGDLIYKAGNHASHYLKRLNGKKYLIKGNHDKFLGDSSTHDFFEWIKDYHVLSYKDARFVLFHYPIAEWDGFYRKSAHCYGHVHNNVSHLPEDANILRNLDKRAINVGVDMNNFFPVSAEEIYNRAFGKGSNAIEI